MNTRFEAARQAAKAMPWWDRPPEFRVSDLRPTAPSRWTFTVHFLVGGEEVHLRETTLALDEMGYRVFLYAIPPSDYAPRRRIAEVPFHWLPVIRQAAVEALEEAEAGSLGRSQ